MLGALLHLLLTTDLDLDAWKAASDEDEHPHHLVGELRDAFSAVVHRPEPSWGLIDRLMAPACATPAMWAMARRASRTMGHDDIVFSVSEDLTVSLVLWLRLRRSRAVVVTSAMNPGRTRMKVLFRAVGMRRRVARFVALTSVVEDILRNEQWIPADRVGPFPLETDFEFFRPLPRSGEAQRPLVFAAGLEQRDYATLAAAVDDLDVEVEVCATSPDASTRTRMAMPERLPSNLQFRLHDWVDYRARICDAALVVVPVLPNRYGAGLTTMVEGLACGRPVIVTDTGGLPGELAAAGALIAVPPGDVGALREAIARVVADPEAADELGRRGRVVALERFGTRCSIEALDRIIRDVAPAAANRPTPRPG